MRFRSVRQGAALLAMGGHFEIAFREGGFCIADSVSMFVDFSSSTTCSMTWLRDSGRVGKTR